MNYHELQQKELLINYIICEVSKISNIEINFELILKYNNSLIKGTSLRNFNKIEFSSEYIINHFSKYSYSKHFIDYYVIYNKVKESHIISLSNSLKSNKLCFKEKLLSLINEFDINFELKSKELNLYNVNFLESNLSFDFINTCEQDNFEIISLQLTD